MIVPVDKEQPHNATVKRAVCAGCGDEFVVSKKAGRPPKLCKTCREKKPTSD
jgi:hypothetical protein